LQSLLSPGAEIGRQACLRGMCSLGRAGSSPAPGTLQQHPHDDTQQSDVYFALLMQWYTFFLCKLECVFMYCIEIQLVTDNS
jgi:hypothetical protein